MKRKSLIGILCILIIVNLFLPHEVLSAPQKPIELTFSHFIPSVGIMGQQYQKWAQMIEERTGGMFKIKFFWSTSLMSMTEALNGVASGIADIATISSGYYPTQFARALALEHAFNSADLWVAIRAVTRLYQTHPELDKEFERNGVKRIAPYSSGIFQLLTGSKWTGIDDLKGKVIRTMGGSRALWLEKLGAKPMFMPITDCYEGLERKTFWGFECNTSLAHDLKHYEVIKTAVIMNSGVVMSAATIINLEKFNSFPKNIQKIIMDTGIDWGENHIAKAIHQREEKILKEWERKGIILAKPTASEMSKLKAVGREAAIELARKQDTKLNTAGETESMLKDFWKFVDEAEQELKQKGHPWK